MWGQEACGEPGSHGVWTTEVDLPFKAVPASGPQSQLGGLSGHTKSLTAAREAKVWEEESSLSTS